MACAPGVRSVVAEPRDGAVHQGGVCGGEGEYETTIGGDGYDDRCCAQADVPVICGECDGTGYVMLGV